MANEDGGRIVVWHKDQADLGPEGFLVLQIARHIPQQVVAIGRLWVFALAFILIELSVRSVNVCVQIFMNYFHSIKPCLVAEEPEVLVPLKPQSETSENVHHGPAYRGSLRIY